MSRMRTKNAFSLGRHGEGPPRSKSVPPSTRRSRRIAWGLPRNQSQPQLPTTLQNRGAKAWEKVQASIKHGHNVLDQEVDRILAHKVTDRVALTNYILAVRMFLDRCLERGWPVGSPTEVDHALSKYINVLCYEELQSVEKKGKHSFWGRVRVSRVQQENDARQS